MKINKQIIVQWLITLLWIVIGAGVVVLLVAAINKKDTSVCSGIQINIMGVSNNFFVDKNDILNEITLHAGGNPVGRPIGGFELGKIEKTLVNNIWVNSAQLYFDNNDKLQVNVIEREPVARVFNDFGQTFYVDSSLKVLPLSDKYSARVPVFSNFPVSQDSLTKKDSLLLKDIVNISMVMAKNDFIAALIDQVDITPQRSFEMIPKLGDNIIVFGDGKSIEEKFRKLSLFYKEILLQSGWDYYGTININYANQVVAKKKGLDDVKADSLRVLQIMKIIAENAEKMSADSLQLMLPDNAYNTVDSNLVMQSLQRDDEGVDPTIISPGNAAAGSSVKLPDTVVKKTPVKTLITTTSSAKPTKVPVVKKKEPPKPKPKPVVKKPTANKTDNDY